MDNFIGGAHVGGMFFWWIFVAFALVGIVWMIVRSTMTERQQTEQSPVAILKKRYAAGEIDADEYRARLDEIKK